jgi:hypothetical protein
LSKNGLCQTLGLAIRFPQTQQPWLLRWSA